MAAITQVLSYHGASPVGSDISNTEIHWKRADEDSANLNNPVDKPTAGTGYSWRKYTKLNHVSGLTGQIGNIRWFADLAPEDWAFSAELYAGTTPSYTQPSSADESAQVGGTVNVDAHTQGSPLLVAGETNAITAPGTGSQPYVVQQMGVLSTATAGRKTPRRFVYRYDES